MAIDFVRGSSQNISVPYNASQVEFGSSDFALSCWAIYESPATGGFAGLISKWETSGNNLCWTFQKDTSQRITFRLSNNGSANTVILNTTGTLSADTIYHIVAQRKSDTLYVYFNGSVDATTASAAGITVYSDISSGFGIGVGVHVSNSNNWDGKIWDARIYNRSLSDPEIESIYNAQGSDGIVNGLVGRYKLDEANEGTAVSTALDVSPIGNDGTDTNSPNYIAQAITIN